jgi:hypothetical protein
MAKFRKRKPNLIQNHKGLEPADFRTGPAVSTKGFIHPGDLGKNGLFPGPFGVKKEVVIGGFHIAIEKLQGLLGGFGQS